MTARWLIRCRSITDADVRLYTLLADLAFESSDHLVRATDATLAQELHKSPLSISRGLARLEHVGAIRRNHCKPGVMHRESIELVDLRGEFGPRPLRISDQSSWQSSIG